MNDWLDPAVPDTFPGAGEEHLTGASDGFAADDPHVLGDHLWLYDDGAIWDLGPAVVDADADGVDESLTRGTDGELTVYTDRDLDGRVDRIVEVGATGETTVTDLDPDTGQWRSGVLGRLD